VTSEWHAAMARALIEACGGLAAASDACRVGRAQLSRAQQGEVYLTADVIADLETHCGQPIYSSVLFNARTDGKAARDIVEGACIAAEAAAALQREIRVAMAAGTLTPGERRRLIKLHARVAADLIALGEMLATAS
jgi:hypothetical protein